MNILFETWLDFWQKFNWLTNKPCFYSSSVELITRVKFSKFDQSPKRKSIVGDPKIERNFSRISANQDESSNKKTSASSNSTEEWSLNLDQEPILCNFWCRFRISRKFRYIFMVKTSKIKITGLLFYFIFGSPYLSHYQIHDFSIFLITKKHKWKIEIHDKCVARAESR